MYPGHHSSLKTHKAYCVPQCSEEAVVVNVSLGYTGRLPLNQHTQRDTPRTLKLVYDIC